MSAGQARPPRGWSRRRPCDARVPPARRRPSRRARRRASVAIALAARRAKTDA